ncbi:MAG: serine hydrolase [Lewinellaceae bacterium]|nr:serine hydrolase [Lewinellaceae bacterium]
MHILVRLFTLVALLLPATFFSQNTIYFPPKTGTVWETTSPASLGFCPERIDSLYQMLENRNTKSFILLQDGKIVLEKYFGTFTRDSFWYWASAGKSLSAFLVGQAQEEGLLDINAPTSTYLGAGWTSAPPDKEALITVRDQLRMTSGLDDGVPDVDCTDPACLLYKADAGTRWAYHNGVYHLVHNVIEAAGGQGLNVFTKTHLLDRIGMTGLWINHIQYGRARDMARFGLLMLAKGVWAGDTLLHNQQYLYDMVHPSQMLNRSYGYLWWLNGQQSFMLPGFQLVLPGEIIPNAPGDMYAALGKNDQKIHVVPSKGWVVVRQGNAGAVGPGGGTVPIILDNEIWAYLNQLVCTPVSTEEGDADSGVRVWPNPAADGWNIAADGMIQRVELYAANGRLVQAVEGVHSANIRLEASGLPAGIYAVQVRIDGRIITRRVALVR